MSVKKHLASLSLIASLAVGSNASAFSDYCATLVFPAYVLECTAGPVPANSSGQFVRYETGPFAKYWFKDIHTGVIVKWGNAGLFGKRETVFGLVGWYELRVKHIGATYGYLNNT